MGDDKLKRRGKLPVFFSNMKDEEIVELGRTLNKEDDVLASLGLNANQIARAKGMNRWRSNWDKGYAQGLVAKGKEMFESTEPAIQKLYADKVVPQAQEIEQVVEWTAPKWFYEELKVDKIKSARRSV